MLPTQPEFPHCNRCVCLVKRICLAGRGCCFLSQSPILLATSQRGERIRFAGIRRQSSALPILFKTSLSQCSWFILVRGVCGGVCVCVGGGGSGLKVPVCPYSAILTKLCLKLEYFWFLLVDLCMRVREGVG